MLLFREKKSKVGVIIEFDYRLYLSNLAYLHSYMHAKFVRYIPKVYTKYNIFCIFDLTFSLLSVHLFILLCKDSLELDFSIGAFELELCAC